MPAIEIDPVYLQIGVPALALGLLLGGLLAWFIARNRRQQLQQSVATLATRIKDQDALQLSLIHI